MMTEIREVNGKKYRFASLSEGHETYNKCSCCIFTGRCPSVIDCSDGFFIEEVKEEPPTKEQILKILRIYFQNDDVPCIGCGDFELDKKYVEQCVEQIIKHLNNE